MRALVLSSLAALAAVLPYRPPVDAPVVDPFRPPESPFGAGNRGVDFATPPGTPVGAAAAGEVVFAGPVGGRLHVVVLHADGIRTSYSFLAAVTVRAGDRVVAGQEVGRSGPSLHFGARRGDVYIDPLTLFGPLPTGRVHLVPDVPESEQRPSGRARPPHPSRRLLPPRRPRWLLTPLTGPAGPAVLGGRVLVR